MQSEYTFLITLGALLILSRLTKSLLECMHLPVVIGYILLGIFISIFDHHWHFLTPLFENTFETLAHIGIVALLFHVGLKSNIRALLAKLPSATLIWLGDVMINLSLGFIVAHYALTLPLVTSLVIAIAFSATSVAVSIAVFQETHQLNTDRG